MIEANGERYIYNNDTSMTALITTTTQMKYRGYALKNSTEFLQSKNKKNSNTNCKFLLIKSDGL